nr:hypothetical protein [Tanacetum cinerariifolium]
MDDKEEITNTVDMFRATLKLLVETPEQPFIPPAKFDYIKPFLRILSYQGILDKVSAFFTKNLAQPWQTMFKKYELVPKIFEEDYHTIKDDTLLAYKDYKAKYGGIEVPMIQPEPMESTQGMHRTPRATRTPNPDNVVQMRKRKRNTSISLDKTAKVYEEQHYVAVVEQHILDEDVEKLVEGEEEESDSIDYADTVLLSDEDFSDRLELESHKDKSKKINYDDDDENKDDKKDDDDNDDDDDHALIRI